MDITPEEYFKYLSNNNENKHKELLHFSKQFITNKLPSITCIYHPITSISINFLFELSIAAKLNVVVSMINDYIVDEITLRYICHSADICWLYIMDVSTLSKLINNTNVKSKFVMVSNDEINVTPGLVHIINLPVNVGYVDYEIDTQELYDYVINS